MRARNRFVVWVCVSLLAWASLTALASLACAAVWRQQNTGAPAHEPRLGWATKRIANVAHVMNAPAWFVVWRTASDYATLRSALIANGLGFGGWIGGAWCVYGVRRWWRRPVGAAALTGGDDALAGPALTRRAFLADAGLGLAAAGAMGSGVAGTLVTPWALRVRRYDVPIRDLPASLEGLRIVQVTDTHLGPRIPEAHVRRAVAMALEQRPDIVALTGDYVHNSPDQAERAAALFAPLLAPGAASIGVIGVLGNHDHYADARRVDRAMRSLGVRMIDNDRVYLDASSRRLVNAPPAQGLCLAGVGDLYEDTIDLRRALRDAPAEMPRLLLSHNPDVAEDADVARADAEQQWSRVDLMLSGHTHGGQVRLPFVGAPIVPSSFGGKYAQGLVQGPGCAVVVSAGIGMSLLPVRFGVPPEVVCVTLRRAT